MATPFKIDKNGTKYYLDCRCRRCGGEGGSSAWNYTGWTCYRCHGTGYDPSPRVYKEYTPEYEAKLEARRQARYERKAQERRANAEAVNLKWLEKNGFTSEGYTYCALGNTYDIKDQLKSEGYKFSPELGWHIAEPADHKHVMIDIIDFVDTNDFGEFIGINWDVKSIVKEANEEYLRQMKAETDKGFVGNIGDRIVINVAEVKSLYTKSGPNSWISGSTVYRIVDSEGHIFIWSTGSWLGDCKAIKATIKDHSTYKGESQTVITRGTVISSEEQWRYK